MCNVIVIGPSRKTRGGITAVIKEYEKTKLWNDFNCKWIETSIDSSKIYSILYFVKAILKFLLLLPGSKIIHIHLSERTTAIRKFFFFWPAYWLGKIIIIHFHAFSPESTIKGKYKFLYRIMFQKANIILVLSEFWKKEIIYSFGNLVNINIVYNPCPDYNYTNNSNKKPEQSYIIFAGTLNARKGYIDLINAFAFIVKMNPNWKLILAGNGEIEKGVKLALSLGIENQVEFKGWVSGEEKKKLFQNASIFCLPSYAEGFPMAVIEAWSYGLPVITTPVGGLPDIMKNRENALVFKPGDLETLQNHLLELITNKNLSDHLRKNSIALTEKYFNMNVISQQVDAIYNNLITKN